MAGNGGHPDVAKYAPDVRDVQRWVDDEKVYGQHRGNLRAKATKARNQLAKFDLTDFGNLNDRSKIRQLYQAIVDADYSLTAAQDAYLAAHRAGGFDEEYLRPYVQSAESYKKSFQLEQMQVATAVQAYLDGTREGDRQREQHRLATPTVVVTAPTEAAADVTPPGVQTLPSGEPSSASANRPSPAAGDDVGASTSALPPATTPAPATTPTPATAQTQILAAQAALVEQLRDELEVFENKSDQILQLIAAHDSISGITRRYELAREAVTKFMRLSKEYEKILSPEHKQQARDDRAATDATMERLRDAVEKELDERQGEEASEVASVATSAATAIRAPRADFVNRRAAQRQNAGAVHLPQLSPERRPTPPPAPAQRLPPPPSLRPRRNLITLPAQTVADRAQQYVARLPTPGVSFMTSHLSDYDDGVYSEDWIENLRVDNISRPYRPGNKPTRKPPMFDGTVSGWRKWKGQFYGLVHNTHLNIYDKIQGLQDAVDPKDVLPKIEMLTNGEADYIMALRILQRDYGSPQDEWRALKAQLHALKGPVVGDDKSLISFVNKARGLLLALDRHGQELGYLLEDTAEKLERAHCAAWKGERRRILRERTAVRVSDFTTWLGELAADYSRLDLSKVKKPQKEEPPGNKQAVGKGDWKHARSVASSASAGGDKFKKSTKPTCVHCGKSGHALKTCFAFEKLSVDERFKALSSIRPAVCFHCLEQGHTTRSSSCPAAGARCGTDGCQRRHHSLLHSPQVSNNFGSADPGDVHVNSNMASGTGLAMSAGSKISFGLLEAIVKVGHREVRAKVVLDNTSDTTFISEAFRKRAGLKQGEEISATVAGIGGRMERIKTRLVNILLYPTQTGVNRGPVKVKAWTLPHQVTGKLTKVDWSQEKNRFGHLKDLPITRLGNSDYPDILIGLDQSDLHISDQTRRGNAGDPYAELTVLGWVIRGNSTPRHTVGAPAMMRTNFATGKFAWPELAEQFFESETFGTEHQSKHSSNDTAVWGEIQAGIQMLQGTPGYSAKLVWRPNAEDLTDNRPVVEGRLMSNLRKLDRNPAEREEYEQLLDKYLESGYAEEAYTYDPDVRPTGDDPRLQPGQYFLPHHIVTKKSNGKKRIVFDASAKATPGGLSMNDCLFVGPKLQAEIPTILTRFREYAVACVADIEAMFSRIRLLVEDARKHQYLWRRNGEKIIRVLRMLRVTFGDGPSPCLAIAVLHRIAEDFAQEFPEAKEIIEKGLYVDDLLDSAKTTEEATTRMEQVSTILAKGDFNLRGWASNDAGFQAPGPTSDADEMLVLGMKWQRETDTLTHVVPEFGGKFTKRELLSVLASLFSPLGLVAPFTVAAKIHLKELHLFGLGWDDDIEKESGDLYVQELEFWNEWLKLLPTYCFRKFPRCLQPTGEIVSTQLHVFGDASIQAFAAVAYLRTLYRNGQVYVALITAKTKVTPKKSVSVDKLELQAAVLAARLAKTVEDALRIELSERYLWTDSSCTRQWIRATSAFYKPYVSHRIGEIQTLTGANEWRHVPGKENVADIATRSQLDVSEETFNRWTKGPEFLRLPEEQWPTDIGLARIKEELRSKFQILANVAKIDPVRPMIAVEKSGNLVRLQRAVARYLLYRNTVRAKVRGWDHPKQFISVDLMKQALSELIRITQDKDFRAEIDTLKEGGNLEGSNILLFDPFLDEEGFLRVGGRIGRAPLPYDVRHPLLLRSGPLAKLIVENLHHRHHHPGTNHLLGILRETYWVIGGRELCKNVGKDCLDCHRARAKPLVQKMADLPEIRFDMTRPFAKTSVDMFGPYTIRLGTAKTGLKGAPRTEQRYGIIFTCLSTRAVYIVPAESASTAHFLNALRMLECLRGKPDLLYSDNGTNFVGAEAILRPVVERLADDPEFQNTLVNRGIAWQRYPPGAAHMGGVHEALIRSAKRAINNCLDRAQKHRYLTEPELILLFAEVTSFLNNRPLTYASADPKDGLLRPIDFLSPRAILGSPPGVVEFTTKRARDSYEMVQALVNEAWSVWMKDYLPTLMTRNKWQIAMRNASVGDLVLVINANAPRNYWPTGRVVKVYPDRHGLVRMVDVKIGDKVKRRPITRCCLLEATDEVCN